MTRATVSRQRVERGITRLTRTYPNKPEIVTFQIRYGDGAGGMVSDTFSTQSKARAALARARATVMDGDHISPTSGDTKFKTVAEDWLASHPDWKERTRRANRWTVEKKLASLHGKRMKQFTTASMLAFRTELLTTPKSNGEPPAPSSVKRTMGVLFSIFEHARINRHLAANPCADLPPLRSRDREIHIPSVEELTSLIARLSSPTADDRPSAHDDRWPLLVETAAYTGLRAGELAGLKKADFDVKGRTLRVRRTIIDSEGGLREDTPKSKASRRTVQIDTGLTKRLERYTRNLKPSDYLFGSAARDGIRQPLRHNQFHGRVFKPVADELGLDITFHDLRHFHASFCIAHDFTALEVAERLGHDKPSFTLDRYSHLFKNQSSSAGDRIGAARGEKPRAASRAAKKPF